MTHLVADPMLDSDSSEQEMSGTMIWFNEEKDHGYISTEAGERLYVAGTGFAGGVRPKGRCAGLAVTFRVTKDGGVRQAAETTLLIDAPSQRARRRHGGTGRGRF
jgi:cold shock CspA family protein